MVYMKFTEVVAAKKMKLALGLLFCAGIAFYGCMPTEKEDSVQIGDSLV